MKSNDDERRKRKRSEPIPATATTSPRERIPSPIDARSPENLETVPQTGEPVKVDPDASQEAPTTSQGPPAVNAEDVAARIREGPKTAADRMREYRARQKQEREREREQAAAKVVTITVPEMTTAMAASWDLALVPLSGKRLKSLSEPQARRLGEAFAPLAQKYFPLFASWQLEVSALLVLVNVIRECYVPPAKADTGNTAQAAQQTEANSSGNGPALSRTRLGDSLSDLPRSEHGPRGSNG